jgi:hypothetical protein
VEVFHGRVVYAVSSLRLCSAAYVLGLGIAWYQEVHSVMYLSWTWRRSQERDTGSAVVGGSVVACLAMRSASSLPEMSVWPGTQCSVTGTVRRWRRVEVVSIERARSWPGPVDRQDAHLIADWLSVKRWMARSRRWWRRMYLRQVFKLSSMARSSASKTSEEVPMGMTARTSRRRPFGM